MRRFKTLIQEMAAVNVADLNTEFISKAERVISFNLSPNNFTNLEFKNEIQYLIKKHYFPKFDLSKTIKGQPTVKKLNALIEPLKSKYPSMYNKLHNYNLKGVGPGEATLYFLLDDGYLGGGTSGGIDMTVGSTPYEIKAALVNSQKTHVSGFKLGAGVDYKRIITELMKMKDEYGIKTTGKGKEEIPGKSGIMVMRERDPQKMAKLDKEFQKECRDYFGNKQVIFISNNSSSKIDKEFPDAGKQKVLSASGGTIISIQKVNPLKCQIQVVTQGVIKPIISLK